MVRYLDPVLEECGSGKNFGSYAGQNVGKRIWGGVCVEISDLEVVGCVDGMWGTSGRGMDRAVRGIGAEFWVVMWGGVLGEWRVERKWEWRVGIFSVERVKGGRFELKMYCGGILG